MKFRLLSATPEKTFIIVFDKGDEFTATLLEFAEEQNLRGSHFTGLGAFSDVTFGFFDRQRRDYERTELDEQVEVMSLIGNIASTDNGPKIHAHVVVGKRDGTAHGGHLLEAHVWPTLELILIESSIELRRTTDNETGLPLIGL
ncbi:MAG TPA: PPC domain-containing DNA-binding protein [Pyrinomonadaceae bacterium]|jgi:predicted DNA-binding protein with PD1-like motif|nr:PPC domain-containing DNA-binding protein [Pyrinomonadaceae bacterium]